MTFTSIVEILRKAVHERPEETIYSYVSEKEKPTDSLTLRALDQKARATASRLLATGRPGDRVLIVCYPGLDSVVSFISCLYAGLVAVPVAPPRRRERAEKIRLIAADAAAKIIMERNGRNGDHVVGTGLERIHVVNEPLAIRHDTWVQPTIDADTLALLQYTSGSTGNPKGVMISHGNLIANARLIEQAFGLTKDDRAVLWLPMFHDMGLMAGVIQPIFTGYPAILSSPEGFVSQPLTWLDTISRYRATISGGPNFAFDLCSRAASHGSAPALDLSSWRIAFNGAEAVRARSMEEFQRVFHSANFDAGSWRPCYGLAEATLFVSSRSGASSSSRSFVARQRSEGIVHPVADRVREVASVGSPPREHTVVIVDPATLETCGTDEIGEIWLSGPNVSKGYWQKPLQTNAVFGCERPGWEGKKFLRTGDLGFLRDGELFVTGRLKDVIILQGCNYDPSDLERSLDLPQLALRRSAAFSIDVDSEERLVIVCELTRRGFKANLEGTVHEIRRSLSEEHQVRAYSVVLVRPGTIPRTTSGKIRRSTCKSQYLNGQLDAVMEDRLAVSPSRAAIRKREDDGGNPGRADTRRLLVELLARAIGCRSEELDERLPLAAYGIDSLVATNIRMAVEAETGISIPISRLLGQTTLQEHLAWLSAETAPRSVIKKTGAASAHAEAERRVAYSLSEGQRALWFVQSLQPSLTALHLARLITIRGAPDVEAMLRAFDWTVQEHASLRLRVFCEGTEPRQWLNDEQAPAIEKVDAEAMTDEDIARDAERREKTPFDLASEPMIRAVLYTQDSLRAKLFICFHHLVCDLWSLAIVMNDLMKNYERALASVARPTRSAYQSYEEFVAWEAELLSSHAGKQMGAWWLDQLKSCGAGLDLLPMRRGATDGAPGCHRVQVSSQTVDALRRIARESGTTLYTTLLSAFQILLYRYSGEVDFLLGVATAGRSTHRWEKVVGYFVNPIVLRSKVDPRAKFTEHLTTTRQALLEALEQSAYPFSKVVEQLQPARSGRKNPLVQVMCMLQPSMQVGGQEFAPFAFGSGGAVLKFSGLEMEAAEAHANAVQFDLVFSAVTLGSEVQLTFHYDTRVFETGFIADFADNLCALLEAVSRGHQTTVQQLEIFPSSKMAELVSQCNNQRPVALPQLCIHEIIKRQVHERPHQAALIYKETSISYAELDARANKLANYLHRRGHGKQDRVGVLLARSPDLVITILAILKVGAAYIPLDPGYPRERLLAAIRNSGMKALVVDDCVRWDSLKLTGLDVVDLANDNDLIEAQVNGEPVVETRPNFLAYIMFTSGSTGTPKGVMVTHRNVVNFFEGINHRISCNAGDGVLAITSVAFDISVLELMWTLARGCTVVLVEQQGSVAVSQSTPTVERPIKFSLFYFAEADQKRSGQYHLLTEGAKLADRLGFEAIWTPERHFHPFGGLYPNPSVTSAALATVTKRIHLRAGSVVLPLQNPIRVAEEWALVDNLSGGRVGVAFASGWHSDDFIFAPNAFPRRKEITLEQIAVVKRLWSGQKISSMGGSGAETEVMTYPRPIQADLPTWLTSGGSKDTVIAAAGIGANLLTHLLGQGVEGLGAMIGQYRAHFPTSGRKGETGIATVMMHAYLDESSEAAVQQARGPFRRYLASSFELTAHLIRSLGLDIDLERMTPKDRDELVDFSLDRYLGKVGLIGAKSDCAETVRHLAEIGVDEVACLIDFGVEAGSVIKSIERLDQLREMVNRVSSPPRPESILAKQCVDHDVKIMQCTPSLLEMMLHDPQMRRAISRTQTMLLGGEPVPLPLVKDVLGLGAGRVMNMYGPTETTVWSTGLQLSSTDTQVYIGNPIDNTQIYILGDDFRPVPRYVTGELCIGGAGVTNGYLGDPATTAERFIPDALDGSCGDRLYRTGDFARYVGEGRIELVGRRDQQIKLRGNRVDLGDVESVLTAAPGVSNGVVIKEAARERMVAFVIPSVPEVNLPQVRAYLRERLPEFMVPSHFELLTRLPLTANGKVDRKLLSTWNHKSNIADSSAALPVSALEREIAGIWKLVLGIGQVGVEDNFFDIGGHSLLMVQVQQKLQDISGRQISLLTLFEYPTIRSLSQLLSRGEKPDQRIEAAAKADRERHALALQRQLAAKRAGQAKDAAL